MAGYARRDADVIFRANTGVARRKKNRRRAACRRNAIRLSDALGRVSPAGSPERVSRLARRYAFPASYNRILFRNPGRPRKCRYGRLACRSSVPASAETLSSGASTQTKHSSVYSTFASGPLLLVRYWIYRLGFKMQTRMDVNYCTGSNNIY